MKAASIVYLPDQWCRGVCYSHAGVAYRNWIPGDRYRVVGRTTLDDQPTIKLQRVSARQAWYVDPVVLLPGYAPEWAEREEGDECPS